MRISHLIAGLMLVLACVLVTGPAAAGQVVAAQTTTVQSDQEVKPRQLLVQPRSQRSGQRDAGPEFLDDPMAWIQARQRDFYGRMSTSLREMKSGSALAAAWTLIFLSFVYGILHAAGPGHGKAVVSAWMLANESQLRRGIAISFLAALVQAVTAIVLVSVLLLTVSAAAKAAKSAAQSLEAASYALIALTGLWLIWQAVRPVARVANGSQGARHHHAHAHDHHDDCGCGHAHMPSASELDRPVSWWTAAGIAFAVGIRPCTGGILVLLFSAALGLYWAGVAATLVMALGTALTVSAIAMIAVKSRGLALRLAGGDQVWLSRTAFGLKLLGGLVIATLGGLLFWATYTNTQPII